jgi:glycosyltransferase involved in cell wall biosynthesis
LVFPEKNRAAYWLAAAGDGRAPIIVPNGAARSFYCPPNDWETLAVARFANQLALYMSWINPLHGELDAIRASPLTTAARLAMIGTPAPEFLPTLNQTLQESQAGDRIELFPSSEKNKLLEGASLGLIVYKPISVNPIFIASAIIKRFEYVAAGLPIVVPDREHYRDFRRDEEWVTYADVDDPRSIAGAIDSILADRERHLAMSAAARRAHGQRLNYETLFQPLAEKIGLLANLPSR